jgi:hypothetical protein
VCSRVCFRDGRGILKTAEKNLASRDFRAGCTRACCWDGRVIMNAPEKKGRLGGDFASTSPSCIAGYRYPPSSSYLLSSSTPLAPPFAKGIQQEGVGNTRTTSPAAIWSSLRQSRYHRVRYVWCLRVIARRRRGCGLDSRHMVGVSQRHWESRRGKWKRGRQGEWCSSGYRN